MAVLPRTATAERLACVDDRILLCRLFARRVSHPLWQCAHVTVARLREPNDTSLLVYDWVDLDADEREGEGER